MLASTTLTEASILVLGFSSLLVAISVFTLIHNCKARIVFRALALMSLKLVLITTLVKDSNYTEVNA